LDSLADTVFYAIIDGCDEDPPLPLERGLEDRAGRGPAKRVPGLRDTAPLLNVPLQDRPVLGKKKKTVFSQLLVLL
jgi:hypothetical protein